MNRKTFLDIHVLLDAILAVGIVEQIRDLADSEGRTARTATVKAFAKMVLEAELPEVLVTSLFSIETLRRKLVEVDNGFDPKSAETACGVVMAMVYASGGTVYTPAEIEPAVRKAQNLVASHVGRRDGEVDHEDLHVIAACLLAAEEDDSVVVLVSDDNGIKNCAGALERRNIAVLGSDRHVRAMAVAA